MHKQRALSRLRCLQTAMSSIHRRRTRGHLLCILSRPQCGCSHRNMFSTSIQKGGGHFFGDGLGLS